MAAAVFLIAVSCGEGAQENGTTASELSLDDYLVAIINAEAVATECGSSGEARLNEAQPDDPTATERFEYLQSYLTGFLTCTGAATAAIGGLQPPGLAADTHDKYIAARRAYESLIAADVEAATTLDGYEAAIRLFFEPDPELIDAIRAISKRCGELEDLARDNGWDADLDCPVVPEPSPVVTVTREASGWTVDRGQVAYSDSGVEIVVRNESDEAVSPVVVFVVGYPPAQLPRIDTDLCRNEPDHSGAGIAEIRCIEPGIPEEGAPYIVDDLAPGEAISEIDHSGTGSYVILNYAPGAYEAGDYIVIEVVEGAER